jgi:hypothetical protein
MISTIYTLNPLWSPYFLIYMTWSWFPALNISCILLRNTVSFRRKRLIPPNRYCRVVFVLQLDDGSGFNFWNITVEFLDAIRINRERIIHQWYQWSLFFRKSSYPLPIWAHSWTLYWATWIHFKSSHCDMLCCVNFLPVYYFIFKVCSTLQA